MAVFSISTLSIETVYWYSASSFMWALLALLISWEACLDGRKSCGWVIAALASAASPAFSAVGLLAGPVVAVRGLATAGRRVCATVMAPLAGTLVYLLFCVAYHDRQTVVANLEQKASVAKGLREALAAPAAVLLPSVAGRKPCRSTDACAIALSVSLLAVVVLAVRRDLNRPLCLGGLGLIVGGYAITFCHGPARRADR